MIYVLTPAYDHLAEIMLEEFQFSVDSGIFAGSISVSDFSIIISLNS